VNDNTSRPHQYGRHTDRAPGAPERSGRKRSGQEFRPYGGEGYYDLPVVKPSQWGWLISAYFFIGGLAGAAQLIAAAADLFGGPAQRPTVRAGRSLAFAGVLISPILLILDLHTPSRWFNMLRIMRPTSPMSIGSWTLTAFGFTTSASIALMLIRDRSKSESLGWLERVFGIAGAVAGTAMATYTATLLSSTSIPLWLVSARQLPVLFGSSAMASAVAAIGLVLTTAGPGSHRRPLSVLALLAAGAQYLSSCAMERAWRQAGITDPRTATAIGLVDRLLVKRIGLAVPAMIHAAILVSGRALPGLSAIASLAALTGCFAERWLLVSVGSQSAARPTDYFRISQPRESVG
jgi:formate-dependent nitrite reductase membrane component NrfD